MKFFKKHKSIPIFPPSLLRSLEMRLREGWGTILIFFALYMGASVFFYSPLDASLNTVTTLEVTNAMGPLGAILADLLYQTLNVMAWPLIVAILINGAHVITYKKSTLTFKRLIALVGALALGSIFAQSLYLDQVNSPAVTQSAMKGGVIGLFLTQKIYTFMKGFGLIRWFIPFMILCFFCAVFLWKYSVNLTFKQMYHSAQKVTIEILKLIQKVKMRRQLPTTASQVFQEEQKIIPEERAFKILRAEESSALESAQKLKKVREHRSIAPENNGGYQLPSVDLLGEVKERPEDSPSKEILNALALQLLNVLSEFGIAGEIVDVQPGPIVTMYEFRPAPGIKTSRVISLSDDIARSMSALSARIATIPGKNAIGIELPNEKRQTVYLRTLLSSPQYLHSSSFLPLVLGKDISGRPVIADLAKMPHLLVAGTTGSGKSVSINTMILSLIYQFSPNQCKFIMIDPKMLELSVYNDIPHLLTPVVTEPKKAIFALKWAVREMESRYRAMSRLGVRNIDGFNQRLQEGRKKGDVFRRHVQTGFDPETGKPLFEDQPLDYKELPYIVIVVDEMADLMLVAGKEIESAVQRLAQMARAAGLHLIMATQRPSVDVITGTIKANFPTRISFQVTSRIDSRTILGEQGAEHLLGNGDMLYMTGGGRIQRVHGPFVSDEEVEQIAQFLKSQGEPEYVEGITDENEEEEPKTESENRDELFQQAVDLIRGEGRVSTSFIQRRFQIGYNKAARIVEQMEKAGIVSPSDRTGKRELL